MTLSFICAAKRHGLDDVSAVQYTHERVITPIADYVAQTLYKEQKDGF